MTRREGDRPEESDRERMAVELGIVLVFCLLGTIALIAIFGPQTSKIVSVTSGTV